MKVKIKEIDPRGHYEHIDLEVEITPRKLDKLYDAIAECGGYPKVTLTLSTNRRDGGKAVHVELRNWTPHPHGYREFRW